MMRQPLKLQLPFVVLMGFALCSAQPILGQQGGGGGGGAGGRGNTAASRTYPSSGTIGDAYYSIDPETRRVVTIADEDTSRYIPSLSNLDRPKPQVLIKVVFLEVTRNKSSDIGIEGGWTGTGHSPIGKG